MALFPAGPVRVQPSSWMVKSIPGGTDKVSASSTSPLSARVTLPILLSSLTLTAFSPKASVTHWSRLSLVPVSSSVSGHRNSTAAMASSIGKSLIFFIIPSHNVYCPRIMIRGQRRGTPPLSETFLFRASFSRSGRIKPHFRQLVVLVFPMEKNTFVDTEYHFMEFLASPPPGIFHAQNPGWRRRVLSSAAPS